MPSCDYGDAMTVMDEAVLYYRTSFHEADKILDHGFSQEIVSLFELSDIEENGNQGDFATSQHRAWYRGNGLLRGL